MRRLAISFWIAATLGILLSGSLSGQEVPAPTDTIELSLDQAVTRALDESEEIRLARSQITLAGAQISSARSAILPQVNANLGYTRTLASVFSGASAPANPASR